MQTCKLAHKNRAICDTVCNLTSTLRGAIGMIMNIHTWDLCVLCLLLGTLTLMGPLACDFSPSTLIPSSSITASATVRVPVR